jgi:hypothetical protein
VWRSRLGERILKGAEWNLFREGLSVLWDSVEESFDDPDLCFTGVPIFDRLEPAQKLATLEVVGSALCNEDVACPELTAISEGTFAAVFGAIRQWIEMEIDYQREGFQDDDPLPFRELVLASAREDASSENLPEPSSLDLEVWEDLLDALMDRVLWEDRDFEEEHLFLDSNPELGALLKEQLGIADEYFTAVAPDPKPSEIDSIRESLGRLCGRIQGDQHRPET